MVGGGRGARGYCRRERHRRSRSHHSRIYSLWCCVNRRFHPLVACEAECFPARVSSGRSASHCLRHVSDRSDTSMDGARRHMDVEAALTPLRAGASPNRHSRSGPQRPGPRYARGSAPRPVEVSEPAGAIYFKAVEEYVTATGLLLNGTGRRETASQLHGRTAPDRAGRLSQRHVFVVVARRASGGEQHL